MPEDQKNDQPDQITGPGTVINPSEPSPAATSSPPAPSEEPVLIPQTTDNSPPELAEDIPSEPEPTDVLPSQVSWTASEFIAHEKSFGWYISLAALAVVFAALAYLLTKGFISSAVIIAAAIILGAYAEHKPRELKYQLNSVGLVVGNKVYPYEEFKSFSVIPEGGVFAINFMPFKRFSPVLTVYFAPDDEKKITDVLLKQLPYEEPRRDAIDSLMRRIRF
jgi:hypothetical protein